MGATGAAAAFGAFTWVAFVVTLVFSGKFLAPPLSSMPKSSHAPLHSALTVSISYWRAQAPQGQPRSFQWWPRDGRIRPCRSRSRCTQDDPDGDRQHRTTGIRLASPGTVPTSRGTTGTVLRQPAGARSRTTIRRCARAIRKCTRAIRSRWYSSAIWCASSLRTVTADPLRGVDYEGATTLQCYRPGGGQVEI
jgi:hypothetical protein